MDTNSLEQIRAELKSTTIESLNKWRILFVGRFRYGSTDVVASLKRALENLKHTVFHLDTDRHKDILDYDGDDRKKAGAGFGPLQIKLRKIDNIINRFRPQLIICAAGGLCFSEEACRELRRRNILLLGITLSDPDVFPSVSKFAGRFDYHTTNSLSALQQYKDAGITNTLYFPFGIDRNYILADVERNPVLETDVACIGHATGRPERNAVMKKLAEEFRVKVYGNGWELPGAKDVEGAELVKAGRAAGIHINFPTTKAGFTNVKCGVFESVGSGAVLCTQYFDEMKNFFDYDSEIIGYRDTEDLVKKIRELLARPERMESVRRKAFSRLVSEHLYEHRWLKLFSEIEHDLSSSNSIVSAERAQVLRKTLSENNTPRRSVIVSGYFGANNLGDELILRSIADGIENSQKKLRIKVASQNPEATEKLHGLPAFDRTDIDHADEAAASSIGVILGGGGLWHDYTFRSNGGTAGIFKSAKYSLGGFAILPLLAKMYGRAFHVFGMGVGPLEDEEARRFVSFLGGLADSITVRDKQSKNILEEISGWEKEVIAAPDACFALDIEEPVIPNQIKEILNDYDLLAVNVRPWKKHNEEEFIHRLALGIQNVVSRRKLALVGIPFQGGNAVDRKTISNLFSKVEVDCPKIVLEWTGQFEKVFSVIQAGRAVLAMRLHANLIAHRLGKPAIGLCYDPKVANHFDALGLSDYALPVQASSADIDCAIERALLNSSAISNDVTKNIEVKEQQAREAIRELADSLSTLPPMKETHRIFSHLQPGRPTVKKVGVIQRGSIHDNLIRKYIRSFILWMRPFWRKLKDYADLK